MVVFKNIHFKLKFWDIFRGQMEQGCFPIVRVDRYGMICIASSMKE